MNTQTACLAWAEEEFGSAQLNDRRNEVRLVSMAGTLAHNAHVLVASSFPNMTEREAAYDFLENDRIAPQGITRACACATARRSTSYPFVHIPIDQSTLTLRDAQGRRRVGPVGALASGARGLECMTAIAVSPTGSPLGIAAQSFWARDELPPEKRSEKRSVEDRESRFWGEVRTEARRAFETTAPGVRRWFQMDRGADAWMVILDAAEREDEWTTVRASADRAGWAGHSGVREAESRAQLWSLLNAQPLRGRYAFEVRASKTRQARTAQMEIRFAAVTLDLLLTPSNKRRASADVWAVHAREIASSCPAGETPIEWMLLTTHPVTDENAACRVIAGYALRWRIEDFHKQWKGGGLDVEQTQVVDRAPVERWLRLLASVAMRTLRLTHMARTEGERPASDEFDVYELEALRVTRASFGQSTPTVLTMHVLLTLLGELGGHVNGKRNAPGPKILARALQRITPLAEGLRQLEADGRILPLSRSPANQRRN